jgi:hypothetical protein
MSSVEESGAMVVELENDLEDFSKHWRGFVEREMNVPTTVIVAGYEAMSTAIMFMVTSFI